MPHNEDIDDQDIPEELPEGEVFPLETLLEFLANPINIASIIDDETLTNIGSKVAERMNKDEETMTPWRALVDWGQEVNKQTIAPMMAVDGAPFDRAANFKSPVMTEASLRWSDRASTEILRHDDIAKSQVLVKGDESISDKGDRISTHLNYQINFQMDWREKQDKLLYELPNTGNVFKKTFFDPVLETNVTNLIHYPNFIVNMKATSLNEFPFTEILEISRNDVITNERSGVWIETELGEGDDESFDGKFVEHQGWYDLDDDGYEEPYIITMHKGTSQVVRIVPRYEADDVFINNEDGSIISLQEWMEALEEKGIEPDFEGIDIVRIEGTNMITKYGFIPPDDGSYLDWGYYHLLGHLTSLINRTTNLMLDAGKLANQPGGLLSSVFRRAKNVLRIKPGEFQQTDIAPADLANGIYTIPFKGADPTLMQLTNDITQQLRQMSSSIDLSSVLSSNAPASTTLALLQENMISSSAIISRVYRSMSNELDVLADLNSKFTDPEEYKLIVGDPEADFRIDYSDENVNVIPTANPELSSKTTRIQLAEVVLSQIPLIKEEGGNPVVIIQDFFDAIGYTNADAVFEQTEGQASAAQKIEMQQQELLKQQQEQSQQQLDMLAEQQDIERRKVQLSEDKFEFERETGTAKISQELDHNEEELALKGEEQDRKNLETRIKEIKLPLEQNKLFEEGHKLHEEAKNEGNTDDRDS